MKKMNRFNVDRKIRKLGKQVDARDFLTNMVVDQHRKDFFATRDAFEIYGYQNNNTINHLTDLVKMSVEVIKNLQNENMEFRARIIALEKKPQ